MYHIKATIQIYLVLVFKYYYLIPHFFVNMRKLVDWYSNSKDIFIQFKIVLEIMIRKAVKVCLRFSYSVTILPALKMWQQSRTISNIRYYIFHIFDEIMNFTCFSLKIWLNITIFVKHLHIFLYKWCCWLIVLLEFLDKYASKNIALRPMLKFIDSFLGWTALILF